MVVVEQLLGWGVAFDTSVPYFESIIFVHDFYECVDFKWLQRKEDDNVPFYLLSLWFKFVGSDPPVTYSKVSNPVWKNDFSVIDVSIYNPNLQKKFFI